MTIVDQIGTRLEFDKTPLRIISLVPSITELLVDLGLITCIVGVTKFCVNPNYLRKEKVIVGGTKTIKIEKLIQLNPDFIICNKEENTKEIVEKCREITNTYVSDITSITDVLEFIHHFGEIFNSEEKALEINGSIENEMKSFLKFISNKKTIKVAYLIWKKPFMVAANQTFINHLLELNKLQNIFEDKDRYPEVSISDLTNKELELLMLSSEPYPFKEKDCIYFRESISKPSIIVDGEYFSWYGSRLVMAFSYFKNLRKFLDSNFSI